MAAWRYRISLLVLKKNFFNRRREIWYLQAANCNILYLIYQKMYLVTFSGIKQFYKGVSFHPLPHKIFEEKVCKLLSFTRHKSWRSMKLIRTSLNSSLKGQVKVLTTV